MLDGCSPKPAWNANQFSALLRPPILSLRLSGLVAALLTIALLALRCSLLGALSLASVSASSRRASELIDVLAGESALRPLGAAPWRSESPAMAEGQAGSGGPRESAAQGSSPPTLSRLRAGVVLVAGLFRARLARGATARQVRRWRRLGSSRRARAITLSSTGAIAMPSASLARAMTRPHGSAISAWP